MPRLETERLILRHFSADDFETYASWMSNPNIMSFIGKGTTRDRDEAWNNLAWLMGHWQLRGYGLWAVEEILSGKLIGRVGLFNPAGWPGLELGWLLDRAYWGKGYAQEAAHASIDFAFNTLREDRLISLIRPDNEASIRVAIRLGMHKERQIEMSGNVTEVYSLERTTYADNIV